MNVNQENRAPYILHLASWYPNKFGPYDATFIRDQVTALSHIHDAILITVIETKEINSKESETKTLGNLTEHITYIPYSKGLNRYKIYFQTFDSICKSVIEKKGTPGLIHVHVGFKAARTAFLLNKKFNIPYIITEHFTAFTRQSTQRFKWLIQFYCLYYSKKASQVIAVSESLSWALKRKGFKKVLTVSNMIDTTVFQYSSTKRISKSFLHISSLAPHKNAKKILEAFSIVHQTYPDTTLTIISNNDERLIEFMDFKRKWFPDLPVHFKSGQDKVAISAEMHSNQTLVMFSDFETFSLVAAEAVCCGMQVIATRCGGPEEFLDPKIYAVISPGDHKALEQAMKNSLTNTLFLQRAEFAKEFAKKIGLDNFLNSYKQVYNSLTQ